MKRKDYGIVDNGGKNPYERLAFAIIIQAAKDYLLMLEGNDEYSDARAREIERFFKSKFFATLTAIEPEKLIFELGKAAKMKNYNIKKPGQRVLDGYYSIKQAAELIDVRNDKIYKAIKAKRLKVIRANGIYQNSRAELEKFKEQRQNKKKG